MFCTNCGTRLQDGANFCPNCGTQVKAVVQPVNQGNMVMLVSLGDCKRATAAALLQQICGYEADDALLIVDSAPITIARGLNDAQAKLLAQALAEYGLEVSVYDGTGWRELESTATSVWDQTGALIASVASALGLFTLNNRIGRDMMHRWDYPYRVSGTRPPVYRLNSALRTVPVRRVTPMPVRPPVHHAPPPPPPAPRPVPRPAPQPVRPATVQRPAPGPAPRPAPAPVPRPAPQPVRPATPQSRPAGPGPRNGNGVPGGRPGGGSGRRG